MGESDVRPVGLRSPGREVPLNGCARTPLTSLVSGLTRQITGSHQVRADKQAAGSVSTTGDRSVRLEATLAPAQGRRLLPIPSSTGQRRSRVVVGSASVPEAAWGREGCGPGGGHGNAAITTGMCRPACRYWLAGYIRRAARRGVEANSSISSCSSRRRAAGRGAASGANRL